MNARIYLQSLSLHEYAEFHRKIGIEKNSLYIKPVNIEKIDIKRMTYRPP